MKRLTTFLFATAAAFGLSTQAQAQARGDTLTFNLYAYGEPFCRLWTSASDESPIQFQDNRANLGTVRELCNTQGGYVVRATFLNIDGGAVVAGSETAVVDTSGEARFAYGEARSQTRAWQLVDAQKREPNSPAYVRLSISPL